jgi:Tfp pilus assembly protein PilF
VLLDPPFAPAFRALAANIWQEAAMPESMRIARTKELSDAARARGSAALAEELEAMVCLARKQPEEAVKLLVRATQAPPAAEEAEYLLAAAWRAAGNNAKFEQLSWRIISDHPAFPEPYAPLLRHYLDQGQLNAARRVLGAWQLNLPHSVDARLLEATLQFRVAGQRDEAEKSLRQLVEAYPGDARVLANARAFYSEIGQLAKLTEVLEAEVAKQPWNYVALAQLVDIYATQQRPADATRALDAARASLARDPERLYLVSQLYQRTEQPRMVEQVLEEVLRADPAFAPAANDLGYSWADAGQNLPRAEALIRTAVEKEPANPMYLDSLGWAMYKLGRFDEARTHLEQAVIEQGYGDPVVLDHLGDALYRLDQKPQALERWKESAARLGQPGENERPDAQTLRLQLSQKIRQSDAGESVSVAPVPEQPTTPKQAKN